MIRFYRNKQYIGIKYNRAALHIGLDAARKSGIVEVWTRYGRPHNRYDACEWVELPDDPQAKAERFKALAGALAIRQTNRVVPCDDIAGAFAQGYDLIAGA